MKHLVVTGFVALLLGATGCGNNENQDEKKDTSTQVMPNPNEQGKTDTTWKNDSSMVDTTTNKRAPLK